MRTAIRRSLCLGFFLAVGINSHSWGQGFGGIRGQVVDSDFGQPIARSSVVIIDTPFGAMTDDQGNFTISGVPPGAYTLSVRSARSHGGCSVSLSQFPRRTVGSVDVDHGDGDDSLLTQGENDASRHGRQGREGTQGFRN